MFNVRMIGCAVITIVLSLLSGGLAAQITSIGELKDDERASVMFDFNLKKIREHAIFKDFNLKEAMSQANVPASPVMDLEKLDRIFGGSQFPKDPAAMQANPGAPVDYQFFVRMEFADSASAASMVQAFKDLGNEEQQIEGKTYYSPGGEAPDNVKLHRANSITVEAGTDRYVFNKDRNVISSTLAQYWKRIPKDSAIRFCVDIESNRDVMNQMMEQAKATAPSEAAPFLDLVNDLAALSVAVDLDSKTILMLRAEGNSTEGTEKLRTGIDGLLGMGKFFGQQNLGQAGLPEDAQKVFGEVLNALKASADGNTVKVDVLKPEGFDDVIAGLMGR